MRRFFREPGFWSLRTRLLTPIVVLVLVAAGTFGLIEDLWARQEAAALIDQRGSSVLEGIAQRLKDQQRAKEVLAQLIAEHDGLAEAVDRRDSMAIAQDLVPLMARLGLGFIDVYGPGGLELARLGESDENAHAGAITGALVGLNESGTSVTDRGLEVWSSSPVRGPRGIVGALMTGIVLNRDSLNEVRDRDGVELALVRHDRLVSSTVTDSNLLRVLSETAKAGDTKRLRGTLDPFRFHPVAKGVDEHGWLVALVSTDDLLRASEQRNVAVLVGTLVLIAALLLFGLELAHSIARPLEAIVGATQEFVRGDYRREVRPSRIRELNELGQAINHLARQLGVQVNELAHQAFHDPLTTLPNRALFMNRLEHALVRADRRGKPVAILFLDLDDFKLINDNLGHKAGDEVLQIVATRLQGSLRSADTVARFGGDEFTVLLEDFLDLGDAVAVTRRVADAIQAPLVLRDQEVSIRSSIGLAMSASGHVAPDDLLRNADAALYAAKRKGKGRYEVFDPSMISDEWEHFELETDMRRALENGEFRVHYQPIVQLNTGRITEVEALVRWEHPRRGLISPLEFIHLAEKTGLIVPIGQWVLEQSCRQASIWQAVYPSDPPLTMSVNLSARQLQHPALVEDIKRALTRTGVDPHHLKLEITESVAMEDTESAMLTLRRLRELGIQLAVDDFGTGYSVLSYLKRFPVTCLKIDRSFIDGLGHDADGTALVRVAIAFAKSLRLSVTAEGIETVDQLNQLVSLGCDNGQGFYFAKPLTAEAIDDMLASASEARGLAARQTLMAVPATPVTNGAVKTTRPGSALPF